MKWGFVDRNIGLILEKEGGKVERTKRIEKRKKISSKEWRVEIKDRICDISGYHSSADEDSSFLKDDVIFQKDLFNQ